MKILKEIWSYVLIVVLVLLIRIFIVSPVNVDGDSMYPTLKDKEVLLLKKYDKSFERFDIVVFKYNSTKLIKRVVGLPGEHVEYKDNELYINGVKNEDASKIKLLTPTTDFKLEELGFIKIPDDMYLVLGDNRTNSTDSRTIGLISKEEFLGTVNFRLFPFKRFGKIG